MKWSKIKDLKILWLIDKFIRLFGYMFLFEVKSDDILKFRITKTKIND